MFTSPMGLFGGGQIGIGEILVVLLIILLLFGARRLPELARSLGRSVSEFKKGRDGAPGQEKEAEEQKAESPAAPTKDSSA